MYRIEDMPKPVPTDEHDLFGRVETATVGHFRHFGFMHRSIQPLLPGKRIVGTATTIAIPGPDSTLLHHLLCLVRPGDVIVIDRLGDDRYACLGGGVAVAAKAAGVAAAIVDGPCTDISEIREADFPVWGRGLSSITTRAYELGGAINIPVSCGGVVVNPGDAVLADESGALVVPRDEIRAVAEEALARQARGAARLAQLLAGGKLGELSGASSKVVAKVENR